MYSVYRVTHLKHTHTYLDFIIYILSESNIYKDHENVCLEKDAISLKGEEHNFYSR